MCLLCPVGRGRGIHCKVVGRRGKGKGHVWEGGLMCTVRGVVRVGREVINGRRGWGTGSDDHERLGIGVLAAYGITLYKPDYEFCGRASLYC